MNGYTGHQIPLEEILLQLGVSKRVARSKLPFSCIEHLAVAERSQKTWQGTYWPLIRNVGPKAEQELRTAVRRWRRAGGKALMIEYIDVKPRPGLEDFPLAPTPRSWWWVKCLYCKRTGLERDTFGEAMADMDAVRGHRCRIYTGKRISGEQSRGLLG